MASTAHAADDDFDFANALSQRGYQDLAEEQFRSLLSDPSKSAKEKAEGQYGLALIKRYLAIVAANETNDRRRKALPDVLAIFTEADSALQAFIDGNSSHPRLLEAKLDRAKLITDRADYVNRAIANDWLPSDVDAQTLLRQVAGGYDTAIGLLKSVEDKARDGVEGLEIGSDERAAAEDKLGIVWLYRIVALYGKGAALTDSTDGKNSLSQVLDEVVEFAWIFEGSVRGLWAYHYSALATWRLGDDANALKEMLDTATTVDEEMGFAAVRPVALQSYEMLAKMALEMAEKGDKKAVAFAMAGLDQMSAKWPSYMDDAYGQRAELARARLMEKAGQAAAAVGIVQQVVRKAGEKNTGVEYEAGRVLDQLMASGIGGMKLDPGLLRQRAIAKWRDSDYSGAVAAFQDLIKACDTSALMEEFGWDAWDFIGRCHGVENNWSKAYEAFDVIEKAWEKDRTNEKLVDLTDETGWSRVFALNKMAEAESDAGKKKSMQANAKSELETFAKNHPNSRFNQDIETQAAESKLREGKSLRRTGDTAAAIAKLQEAIKLLGAISTESKSIDKAQAQIAQAHLEIARAHQAEKTNDKAAASFDTAIQAGRAWLAVKRPDVVDSRVRQNRDAGRNIALTTVLSSYSGKADVIEDKAARKAIFEAFLAALDELSGEFAKAVTNGQQTLDVWKVEALIGVGKVEEAELLVSALLKKSPDLRNGPYLAALVAQALEKDANSWLSKGDEGRHKTLMIRCARLREYAITKSGDVSPQSYVFLAKTWKAAGDFDKAADWYRKALAPYEAAGNEEMARAVRLELIDLLIDQKKFDEAIKPLEELLVDDPVARKTVVDRLGKDDQIKTDEMKQLHETMTKNKRVLNILCRAYLEAARDQQDLLRAINLSAFLYNAIPKDERFQTEWYEYTHRMALGYFKFAAVSGNPDAYKNVVKIIESRIKVPGLLEVCDESLPGSRRKFEELLSEAKSK